jgi:hypothetical protein
LCLSSKLSFSNSHHFGPFVKFTLAAFTSEISNQQCDLVYFVKLFLVTPAILFHLLNLYWQHSQVRYHIGNATLCLLLKLSFSNSLHFVPFVKFILATFTSKISNRQCYLVSSFHWNYLLVTPSILFHLSLYWQHSQAKSQISNATLCLSLKLSFSNSLRFVPFVKFILTTFTS